MKRLVALACLYPLPSMAAPLPREGVFVYSNLCWEAGSGDPAGYRLKIERAPGGDSLYFEWSEGGLMGAQAAKLTIEPQTGALNFTVLPDGSPEDQQPAYRYVGRIFAEKVTLEKVDWGDGHGFSDIRKRSGEVRRSAKSGRDLPACK